MSRCASLHPAQTLANGGNEPDWEELMRQADAEEDAAADASEAGKATADYLTPNARFGPY